MTTLENNIKHFIIKFVDEQKEVEKDGIENLTDKIMDEIRSYIARAFEMKYDHTTGMSSTRI